MQMTFVFVYFFGENGVDAGIKRESSIVFVKKNYFENYQSGRRGNVTKLARVAY